MVIKVEVLRQLRRRRKALPLYSTRGRRGREKGGIVNYGGGGLGRGVGKEGKK